MKKIIFCALHIVFFTLVSAEPKLFELTKGDKQVFVFGTIHVAHPDYYPLADHVINSLNKANALAVELDTSSNDVIQDITEFMGGSSLVAKKTNLTETQKARAQEIMGDQAKSLFSYKTFWLAANIEMFRFMNELNHKEAGIDDTLIKQASSKNIKIISLETVEEQFSALMATPESEGQIMLNEALSENFTEKAQEIIDTWKNDDNILAQKIMDENLNKTPIFYQKVVLNRNKAMAKRIEKINQQNQRLFVAVGAAHLYAKGSVIELLVEQGYKLKE